MGVVPVLPGEFPGAWFVLRASLASSPLRVWGPDVPGSWSVVFVVRFSGGWRRVVSRCSSRSGCARLLWRFRVARRWRRSRCGRFLRGVWVPFGRLGPEVPRFGLRWLAARLSVVAVVSPSGVVCGRPVVVGSLAGASSLWAWFGS